VVNRKPQKEIQRNKAIFGLLLNFVALKIETKDIIKNRYSKTGCIKKLTPEAISKGAPIQCTKQIDELNIPIRSAFLSFINLIMLILKI